MLLLANLPNEACQVDHVIVLFLGKLDLDLDQIEIGVFIL